MMKVLYVEDNPDAIQTVQRIAGLAGVELLTATSGAAAYEQVEQQPDVFLIDLKLPDVSGLELVRAFRAMFPAAPIMAITGYALPAERAACFEAGCTDYLSKPYAVSMLLNLLQRYQATMKR